MINPNKFLEHFIGLLFIQVLFTIIAHYIIIPGQGYLEYLPSKSTLDFLKIPIVIFLIIILSFYFSIKRNIKTDLVDFFIYSYLIMLVIPYSSLFLLAGFDNLDKILFGFCLIIFFANFFTIFQSNSFAINGFDFLFKLIVVLMICYFLLYAIYVFLNNPSLNILDFYKNRRIYTSSGFPFLGYVTPWISNVLSPIFIALGLYRKNNFYLFSGIFLSVLVFFFAGFRSAIGIIILVSFFYFLVKYRFTIFSAWIVFASIAATTVLWELYSDYYDIAVFASLFRRAFFAQAGIHEVYLDFFNLSNFTYGSGTFFDLSKGFTDRDPQRIITPVLMGGSSGLNVGWVGDGYSNFGFMGIFIYAFIIGSSIGLLNLFFNNIFKSNAYKYSFIPIGVALTLTNSALTVTFLTHGLAFLMFALFSLQVKKQ